MKMKIGIKLQTDIFEEEISAFGKQFLELYGGIENYLQYLKENVYGVEMSQVNINTNPEMLKKAVELCEKHGLFVTIHGVLYPDITAEEFFAPYGKLDLKKETLLNITLHPLKTPQETEKQLRKIVAHIEQNGYKVRLTLENQRNKNEFTAFAGCMGVKEIVKKINSPHLFVCYDFGHRMSNIKKQKHPEDLIDKEFLSLVRHTHIHSFYDGTTHFPIDVGETALDENISGLLDCNYDEIFLLELMPQRFADKFPVKESLDNSFSILKTAIFQAQERLKETARYEKADNCIKAAEEFLQNDKDGMVVLGPSAYIVKLGKTKIAVDPALKVLPYKPEAKGRIVELINRCDAVVITHEHEDHFDREVLEQLGNNVAIYIPDFIDYKNNGALSVTKDGSVKINDVLAEFFESAHSVNNKGILEYGFSLKHGNKTYIFPGDVRDYKKKTKSFSHCEVLVAHLWLGRQNALKLYNDLCTNAFCEFVKSFNAEKVYISHLYHVYRKIDDMWTEIHYDLIKDRIKNSAMIKMGDIIYF